jgi:N6-adenosine-specific RNA methylase IME4
MNNLRPNVMARALAAAADHSYQLDAARGSFVGHTRQSLTTPHAVICADPPWLFDDKLPGASRGAEKNYAVMTVEDLCAMQLPMIADDAILALWRVSSMVEEAYRVVRAWGFEPKAEIVWRKRTKKGKRHFGMGRLTRGEHETAILATRGRYSHLVKAKNIRSTFSAPVPSDEKGRPIHSAKPEKFSAVMEKLARGPYCELFSRRQRPGWTCVGKEMPTSVALANEIGVSQSTICRVKRGETWRHV